MNATIPFFGQYGGHQRPGQPDVLTDHPGEGRRADLAECQPDLERAEATRVLQAEFVVVDRRLFSFLIKLVVVGMEAEGIAEVLDIADPNAPGFERAVEPLARCGSGTPPCGCPRRPSRSVARLLRRAFRRNPFPPRKTGAA